MFFRYLTILLVSSLILFLVLGVKLSSQEGVNNSQKSLQPSSKTEVNTSQKTREEIPQETPDENGNILIAVGDIMLSRHVGAKIRAAEDNKLPFRKTAEILKSGDITFANLESPFNNSGRAVTKGMVFKAEPETIEGLVYAGIDIVSLANNHFGDQKTAGMNFTFEHLTNHKIKFVGAGKDEIQARQPKVIEKNGIKFAFLGYADSSSMTPESYRATSAKPGVAWLAKDKLMADIKKAKSKADIVVVSAHWGTEYQQLPNERQKTLGREAIEAGASLVLGHHPHVIQPYEKYKNGYIFYSLGNFVFDQMWSEKTRKGQIAKIYFRGKKIEKVEVVPVKIYDYNQPRPE